MGEGPTYRLQEDYPLFDCGEQSLADLFRHKQSVLLVEDEEDSNHALACRLRREGFHVVSTCDDPTLLRGSEARRPDVVLLDLASSRTELLEELARCESLRDVPVIALSRDEPEDASAEARRLGVREVLRKSADSELCVARVRAACESAAHSA